MSKFSGTLRTLNVHNIFDTAAEQKRKLKLGKLGYSLLLWSAEKYFPLWKTLRIKYILLYMTLQIEWWIHIMKYYANIATTRNISQNILVQHRLSYIFLLWSLYVKLWMQKKYVDRRPLSQNTICSLSPETVSWDMLIKQ